MYVEEEPRWIQSDSWETKLTEVTNLNDPFIFLKPFLFRFRYGIKFWCTSFSIKVLERPPLQDKYIASNWIILFNLAFTWVERLNSNWLIKVVRFVSWESQMGNLTKGKSKPLTWKLSIKCSISIEQNDYF